MWINHETTAPGTDLVINTIRILICDTKEKLNEAIRYLQGATHIAIDTETTYNYNSSYVDKEKSGALRQDNVMLGISLSIDEKSGVWIPFCKNGSGELFFDVETTKKLVLFFRKQFMSNIQWIFHNGLFDIRVLKRHIGIAPLNIQDTLIATHEYDENLPMALKPLCVLLFGADADEEKREMLPYFIAAGYTKVEMGLLEKIPMPVYGKYAAKDTILTFALRNFLKRGLVEKGLSKRYSFKKSILPVYEEINSVGWPIDEQVLYDSGEKIKKETKSIVHDMRNSILDIISTVENEKLRDGMPIKQTPSWYKLLIHSEGLEAHFTVPMSTTKRSGEVVENANGGSFTTAGKYKTNFLESTAAHGSLTAEFLRWNGVNESDLSEDLYDELNRIRKQKFIADVIKSAEDSDKIELPYVFNPASGQVIGNILFKQLGLTPLKVSQKSGEPDVSSEILRRLQGSLFANLSAEERTKVTNSELSYTEKVEILKECLIQRGAQEYNGTYIQDKCDKATFDSIRTMIFLELLMKYRDNSKVYGTYVMGLLKLLYTAKDLKREPQFSPITGNELKYLISNVNPCGTKTGRPSSNTPNQLNFPNDKRIKDAFIAPVGYKFMSADFAAQEVRETCNVTHDPGLKEVFSVVCSKCKTEQQDDLRLKIGLDLLSLLKPIVGDKAGKHINQVRTYMLDQVKYPQLKPIKVIQKKNKKGILEDVNVYQEADPSICCPTCGAYSWSEPDPHSLTAQRVFSECTNLSLGEIKERYGSTLRQQSKILQFLMLYGGNEFTLADRLYQSTAPDDVKRAKEIIDNYFKSNTYLRSTIDRVVAEATVLGYVETIGGYRRHLPDLQLQDLPNSPMPYLDSETKSWKCFGKVDLDWDDTQSVTDRLSFGVCPRQGACPYANECKYRFKKNNIVKLRNRAIRQAFNILIQGNSADHTNVGLKNFLECRIELAKTNPLWAKVKVISQIYDAIYILVPDELVEEVMPVVLDCMENTFPGLEVKHILEPEPPGIRWSEIH